MPAPTPARLFTALAAAVLSIGATAPAAKTPSKLAQPEGNFIAQVVVSPSGSHIIGNPKAKLRLIEYMSYTCPHCAHFEEESALPIRLKLIATGKASFEIRHYLRDPVDMAVALLVNCAPPSRFWGLHHAFLATQADWLGNAQKANATQQARWTSGPIPQRMRALAHDLHFYEFMEDHGVERLVTDRCLGNEALTRRLSAQTADGAKLGIEGTPSFLIDDVLLAGTHDWKLLEPQLSARM